MDGCPRRSGGGDAGGGDGASAVLIVVRHGRTASNASGLLLGRSDPGLDDLGRRQADALAVALHAGSVGGRAARVVCSPLLRTRETAEALGLPVTIDDRWIELDYGVLDGTALTELPAELWERWVSDPDFAPDGGESIADLGVRVRAACEDLADEAAERDVIVVTHVSPVKAAVGWALGVGDHTAWHLYVAPASITRIAVGRPRRSLHAFNVVAHLDDLG
jgi:broad specificity phosphatase PhoE